MAPVDTMFRLSRLEAAPVKLSPVTRITAAPGARHIGAVRYPATALDCEDGIAGSRPTREFQGPILVSVNSKSAQLQVPDTLGTALAATEPNEYLIAFVDEYHVKEADVVVVGTCTAIPEYSVLFPKYAVTVVGPPLERVHTTFT